MAIVTIEQARAALNLGTASNPDTSHDTELQLYMDAAEEHVSARGVVLDATEYTEQATFSNGTLITRHWPILTVVSLEDDYGSSYVADFTIGSAGYGFEHDSIVYGTWNVTYTAGFATVPADLKLAVLEDIRGLYQPGQIGPAAEFGMYGTEAQESVNPYRPVGMWPRLDAWITFRFGPTIFGR